MKNEGTVLYTLSTDEYCQSEFTLVRTTEPNSLLLIGKYLENKRKVHSK